MFFWILKRKILPTLLMLWAVLSTPVALADTLKIGGTGSSLETMRILGKAFRKEHPETQITVLPSLGSSGGIKAVLAGAIDIGLSSRSLKDAERNQGAVAIEYGRTPFVFVASIHNKVDGLTTKQLADIYADDTVRWPDGKPIRLVLRPAGDTDSEMIKSISPEVKAALIRAESRPGMLFAVTDQEAADTCEKIPGILGSSTLSQLISEKRRLKALSLNGVVPSPETIRDGSYPYYKRLFLVTAPKPSPATQQFILFVRSKTGQGVLVRNGHWVVEANTGR